MCALWSLAAASHADTQNALHHRFLESIGLYDQIDQQLQAIEALGADTARRFASQIVDAFPDGLPAELEEDMRSEIEIYMGKINGAMNSEVLADTYLNLITTQLSDAEISELSDFYESDIGRKFTDANTAVMGEWATIVQSDAQNKISIYTQEFI